MIRFDINNMREIAQLRKGKCLSKEYIDKFSPLKWMCSKGHTWDTGYYLIQRGGWCSQCAKEDIKEQYLHEIKQLAKSKKGKCLSDEYKNNHTHLKFQCAEGHTWSANANNIKTGHWCPYCVGYVKLKLIVFQDYAKSKNGKCLSSVYKNIDEKLEWQCSKGHKWKASGDAVKNRHSWCPVCANRIKYTAKDMQRIAKARGGKFLSTVYDPYNKMKWQCDKGHIWQATSNKILLGRWCHVCGNYKSPKSL